MRLLLTLLAFSACATSTERRATTQEAEAAVAIAESLTASDWYFSELNIAAVSKLVANEWDVAPFTVDQLENCDLDSSFADCSAHDELTMDGYSLQSDDSLVHVISGISSMTSASSRIVQMTKSHDVQGLTLHVVTESNTASTSEMLSFEATSNGILTNLEGCAIGGNLHLAVEAPRESSKWTFQFGPHCGDIWVLD